jgi:hypothetical protein
VALVMVARSWGGMKKLVGQICPDTKKGGEYPYFISLSVTTKTESYGSSVPGSMDFDSLTIKSIAISCHAPAGAEFGWSFP